MLTQSKPPKRDRQFRGGLDELKALGRGEAIVTPEGVLPAPAAPAGRTALDDPRPSWARGGSCEDSDLEADEQAAAARRSKSAVAKPAAVPHPVPARPSAAGPILEGEEILVGVDDVVPSPFQPRRDFDRAELESLAHSMLQRGLTHPIVVRQVAPAGGRAAAYQLIAGERRLRAAKLAGLLQLPARLVQADDRQCLLAIGEENLQRQDLSAVEEAGWYRRLLDAEPGLTQEQLGQRLKKSQPHIAGRLALLTLPEAWQKRIITREIPPTHARHLAPWKDYPSLVAAIDKALAAARKKAGEAWPPALDDFEEVVLRAVDGATAQCSGQVYDQQSWQHVAIPKLTAEQRAELQIIPVPSWYGGGKPQERAVNLKAWNKIWAGLVAPLRAAKRAKEAARKAKAHHPDAKSGSAKKKKARALSPEERAAQLQKAQEGWRETFLRYLVARRIRSMDTTLDELISMTLAVAVNGEWCDEGFSPWAVLRALQRRSAKLRGIRSPYDNKIEMVAWSAIREIEPVDADEVLGDALAEMCWEAGAGKSPGKPASDMSPAALAALAAYLKVDPARAWQQGDAAGLRNAFFELHDAQELAAIAQELGLGRPMEPVDDVKWWLKLLRKEGAARMPAAADPLPAEKPKSAKAKAGAKKGKMR